jgi:hypothetical protein
MQSYAGFLLSGAQKVQVQYVELSFSLLRILEVQEQRAWHDIVTLDESWFYSRTEHESIWLRPGEKVPEMTRAMVQCQKWMVTMVWNPTGFGQYALFRRGANSTAAITRVKYSSHSQSGEVDKPAQQVKHYIDHPRR